MMDGWLGGKWKLDKRARGQEGKRARGQEAQWAFGHSRRQVSPIE